MIGHPVWLGDDTARGAGGPAHEYGGSTCYDYTAADEEEERGRTKRRQAEHDAFLLNPEGRYGSASPGDSNSGSSREPSPVPPPTNPLTPSSLLLQPSVTSSQHSHNSLHGSGRLISFNLVCIIDTPPDSHLSSHLEGYYKDIIVPMTANIKTLEMREKWLGRETAKLRRASENYVEKGLSTSEHLASLPTTSNLASALVQLFHAIKSNTLTTLYLGRIPVNVLFRGEIIMDEYSDLSDHEDTRDTGSIDGRGRDRSNSPPHQRPPPPPLFSRERKRPPIKYQPWETFLALEDPSTFRIEAAPGSLMARFLDICSPTLSFAEYETLLDIEVDDGRLKELVNHLCSWKKGKIIDVVSFRGLYNIASTFEPSSIKDLLPEFQSTFPSLPPLPVFLSLLPRTGTFSDMIPTPSSRFTYCNALIWLLAHDLVEKHRVYLRIVISPEVKKAVNRSWGVRRDSSVAESTTDEAGTSVSSSGRGDTISLESGSPTPFSAGPGLVRSRSRPEFVDSRGMAIVGGSALSISPTLSKASPSVSQSFSRSFQKSSALMLGGKQRVGATMGGVGGGRGKGSNRAMSINTFSSNASNDKRDEEEIRMSPSVILEPGRPTAMESRWIVEICRDQDKGVVDKFEKIIRSLNGTFHLDEIRHRASLSRKDLRLVLTAFAPHLITFTHP